jgi:hypothetical protein
MFIQPLRICQGKKVNFQFFNLEDTEFFERYAEGVPVYNQVKTIWKTYSFVHFDGPHAFDSLMTEIDFFYKRITRVLVGILMT